MPKFAYKAIDQQGKETSGIVEAPTQKEAISEIGRMGLYPTNVRKAGLTDELITNIQSRVDADRQRREAEELRRHQAVREKHQRQRLVVSFLKGETQYGVAFHFNPDEPQFHLDLVDKEGRAIDKRLTVNFNDTKAIFFVKSFDGKFDPAKFRPLEPQGEELIVVFKDGEKIKGRSLHRYDSAASRFFLVPDDPGSNNQNILVNRGAIEGAYNHEQYRARKEEKAQTQKEQGGGLCQEETMGDFYFEMRNYGAALEHYEAVEREGRGSGRLKKKLLVSRYNLGVQCIKRREYDLALDWMYQVLKIDPHNEHARKKVAKLKRIISNPEESNKDKAQDLGF